MSPEKYAQYVGNQELQIKAWEEQRAALKLEVKHLGEIIRHQRMYVKRTKEAIANGTFK